MSWSAGCGFCVPAGGHTLGVGHCRSFKSRLQESDPSPGLVFGAELEAACAATELTDLVFLPNDLTNFVFDNQYYADARNGRGLFTIDAELPLDSRTADILQTFANDQQAFFDTFTTAFVKMTSKGVLTGNEGQIRQNCHFVNT
jgi:peroxidase